MHEREQHPGDTQRDTQGDTQGELMRNLAQPESPTDTLLPVEDGIYEQDGTRYRFVREPTGKQFYNRETGQLEPRYHTLQTWFSHSTPGVTDGGPGWDGRWSILDLPPQEMVRRYGHKFTEDEVGAPAGRTEMNDAFEEVSVGGMPDDIFYYGLEKFEDATDNPDRS